jgi:hypothetical protein
MKAIERTSRIGIREVAWLAALGYILVRMLVLCTARRNGLNKGFRGGEQVWQVE